MAKSRIRGVETTEPIAKNFACRVPYIT